MSYGFRDSPGAAKRATKIVVCLEVVRLYSFGFFILRDCSSGLTLRVENNSQINTGNKVIGRPTQDITPQLFAIVPIGRLDSGLHNKQTNQKQTGKGQ